MTIMKQGSDGGQVVRGDKVDMVTVINSRAEIGTVWFALVWHWLIKHGVLWTEIDEQATKMVLG